ncbi:hypothetical protein SAMN02982929_03045 [Saccharopolyspora kobensis]|uniref:DUF308 domain-containing protein n=1 Tax=Saccharopolyspora kobensis TaxID=146035 RepID=A0A1H6C2X6_9PSEU|nr:hypothetical protein [Saccharopolyspora kobensis]SEG67005.1 hypothetical protein SAMN02982929_03045 [Saccharopolyspora kobensis]SFC24697.1 hypothetical protein SAMN05216506_101285 [Saccharopolyspora kobensis]
MAAEPGPTTVAEHALLRRGTWVICPLVGALLLLLLRLASGWVAGLPWAPFQGVFELAASVADPWGTIGAVAIGAFIGFGFAGLFAKERLTVIVAPERLTLAIGDTEQHLDRDQVDAVFVDGKDFVVLDAAGAELVRRQSELDRKELRKAFTEHGYPWRDGDPHEYRLWDDDSSELPLRINALLADRERALRKRDHKEAALLRAELAERGIVVRDSQRRQYWRSVASS